MQLPPTSLIVEAFRETVGPPFAVAVVVMLVARLALTKSSTGFAAVVALIASLAVGNSTASLNPDWWPTSRRFTWLPWLAIFGSVAGWVVHSLKWSSVGHTLWTVVAVVAVLRVVPKEFFAEPWWAVPAFVLLTAGVGFGLMHISERHGFLSAFILACSLMAAGVVVIHAHSKSLLDVATLGGMCLFGIAAVGAFTKSDVGPIFPGAAFLLTGTLLAGFYETYSDVPTTAFVLPAVVPLLPLLGLLPVVDRMRPRWRYAVALLPAMIVLGIAVALAMANETLAFGE